MLYQALRRFKHRYPKSIRRKHLIIAISDQALVPRAAIKDIVFQRLPAQIQLRGIVFMPEGCFPRIIFA
jgi:hypothetical protein